MTEIEKKVIDIFKLKTTEREKAVCWICALTHKNAYEEMLKWLQQNEKASNEDISEKIRDILGIAD